MWSNNTAFKAIIVAGCFSMVYTQLTLCPASIQYARALGANGLHIGILGAIPTMMLFCQFLAAVLANHLHYRRWVWMPVSILQRLVFVPIALVPWLWPDLPDYVWIWTFIGLTALNHAMLHFCTPLWLSWMGDYLPQAGLNRYWGVRHRWMQWAAAASLFAGAWYLRESGLDIRESFGVLLLVGAAFGVTDILIFLRVEEPPVTPVPEPRLLEVLSAPFRHRDFRSFIGYTSFWHFAAMTGAPFISYYLLSYVGLDVYKVLLLWTFSWIGGALLARQLGHWAELFGNRPVLILCSAFKSTNMIALLFLPPDPVLVFRILIPVFAFDAVLNAGIMISNNGFMIKNSPSANRTMFIAAGTAVAGMVGGLTSILTGLFLAVSENWQMTIGGWTVVNFHVAFAVSLVSRLIAAVLAFGVREPSSKSTSHVLGQLIGVTPVRVLSFPLGLYRSWRFSPGKKRADQNYGGQTHNAGIVKQQLSKR